MTLPPPPGNVPARRTPHAAHLPTYLPARLPYHQTQTPDIRAAIKRFTLFCGRFEIPSNATPDHATATSVVVRATDKATDANSASPDDVVLKLMKHEDQFRREIEQRKGLDPAYVVEVMDVRPYQLNISGQ